MPVADWPQMRLNKEAFNEKPYLIEGRIMYPGTHDIFLETLPETVSYLRPWLKLGNNILITTKPRFNVITLLCDALQDYKNQITFRFTIGSMHDEILNVWEPDAPKYRERMLCLEHAKTQGYQTSASIEPYLDGDVIPLAESMLPLITDSIWIGKMREVDFRVETSWFDEEGMDVYNKLLELLSDEFVEHIYRHFKNNPKIHYKDSIKKVIGLPEEPIG